jgi:hypothetical protein
MDCSGASGGVEELMTAGPTSDDLLVRPGPDAVPSSLILDVDGVGVRRDLSAAASVEEVRGGR